MREQAIAKLDRMMQGERVITNDNEMELMLDDDRIKLVRSMPNPDRLGLRDQYVAWID